MDAESPIVKSARYTLIAYKPDSSDYCRNCLMASYSSDFILLGMLTEDQLVSEWANLEAKNHDLGCNEKGYTFNILKEGVQVLNDSSPCWNGDDRHPYSSEEYFTDLPGNQHQESVDYQDILVIQDKVKERVTQTLLRKKELADIQLAQQKAKQLLQERDQKLRQLAQLHQELYMPIPIKIHII